LAQALADAETANARVMDLTARLLEARRQIIAIQSEAESARVELARLQAEHDQMRSSKAWRLAERIWRIRNGFGI
jgi:hypothetical protein